MPRNGTRWLRYSVGRWENDSVVVNSNGTDERTWLDNAGNPHSNELRVEERWHRISEKRLELTVTLDDPMAYTKPWVALDKLPFVQIPLTTDLMEMMNTASEAQAVAAQYKSEKCPARIAAPSTERFASTCRSIVAQASQPPNATQLTSVVTIAC